MRPLPPSPILPPLEPTGGSRSRALQVKRLRFLEPKVEAEFQSDYFAAILQGVRINMTLGAVLFALWGVVDAAVVPHALWFTVPIRLGVGCPVMLGFVLLSYAHGFDRWMVPALAVVDLICGFVMIAIIVAAGPDGHRYYFAGLILTTIGCCACPGLGFRTATVISLAIILVYAATLWSNVAPEVVLNNAMFLVTTEILAISVAYTLERQHRSNFLQRWVIREQAEALRLVLVEVDRTARTDALTGLFNRRHFYDEAATRSGRVSVIILDVDHFKAINDRYGHTTGDQVLRELARRVETAVRPGDVACRYGGEEFAVLLMGADLIAAAVVGERVRRDVATRPFKTGSATLRVTISVGIASISDDGASAIESLIDRADQALYQAKNAGRNRVHLWDRDPAILS